MSALFISKCLHLNNSYTIHSGQLIGTALTPHLHFLEHLGQHLLVNHLFHSSVTSHHHHCLDCSDSEPGIIGLAISFSMVLHLLMLYRFGFRTYQLQLCYSLASLRICFRPVVIITGCFDGCASVVKRSRRYF